MNNALNIVALVTTIISLILAVYFYLKSRKVKRLDIIIGRPISILNSATRLKDKLKVEYDGIEIKNPSMLRLRATCSGNTAIRDADLQENPLRFEINDDCAKFIDCTAAKGNELVRIDNNSGDRCHCVSVKSLNPGDEFELIFLTEGDPAGAIDIKGKVIDGRIRRIDPSGLKSVQKMLSAMAKVLSLALPISIMLFLITGSIFKNLFSIYGQKLISVNVAISTIIGLLISLIIFKLFLEKQVDKSVYSEVD